MATNRILVYSASRMRTKDPELSRRQEEALALIGEGYSDEEIAEALEVTIYTARWHVQQLKKKYRVPHKRDLIPISRNYFLRERLERRRTVD